MKIRTPFRPANEYVPLSGGSGLRTEATAPAVSEAELIETARGELMIRSDEIRLGHDPHPKRTVRALSQAAEMLAHSKAADWEKANALSTAAANIRARGLETDAARQIAHLASVTLKMAYPPETDPYLDKLNRDELAIRESAIQHTSPEVPYPEALSQQWTEHGRPLEPLIDATEEKVNKMWQEIEAEEARRAQARMRIEAAKPRTGTFDPFADEEESDDDQAASLKITA